MIIQNGLVLIGKWRMKIQDQLSRIINAGWTLWCICTDSHHAMFRKHQLEKYHLLVILQMHAVVSFWNVKIKIKKRQWFNRLKRDKNNVNKDCILHWSFIQKAEQQMVKHLSNLRKEHSMVSNQLCQQFLIIIAHSLTLKTQLFIS